MVLKARLEETAEASAESRTNTAQSAESAGPISPFLLAYETDKFDLDVETTDRLLTLVWVASNVL